MTKDQRLLNGLLLTGNEYLNGEIELEHLQNRFSAVMSALEGETPKPLRELIQQSEAELDSIRFTISDGSQRAAVEPIVRELEMWIRKPLPPVDT